MRPSGSIPSNWRSAVDIAAENDGTARKQATPRRRQINRGALPLHD